MSLRVQFEGGGIEPMHIVMDLEAVPRVGEYVSIGDGLTRYVSHVTHMLDCCDFDSEQLVWKPRDKRENLGRGEASIRDKEPRIRVWLARGTPT